MTVPNSSKIFRGVSWQTQSLRELQGRSHLSTAPIIADGSVVTFDLGWAQSLAVQTAIVRNIQIAIGDNRITYGLLGQDFLARYNVRILENDVELHPR